MQLKKLWDTDTKKMIYAKGPSGHPCPVWTNDDGSKLYIYDKAQWLEFTPTAVNDGYLYGGGDFSLNTIKGEQWKAVNGDDMVGYYDTDKATELYHWESGDEVSYAFKDWDGTVLKEGTVKEGTKPTAPADPTREATAQYTYTFAGWNPEVAKISKKTVYTATYNETVNNYTVTIESNDDDRGTVDINEVVDAYGTSISVNDNLLTIGNVVVTATPTQGNHFVGWTDEDFGTLPSTLTEDITAMAEFMDSPAGIVNIEWLGGEEGDEGTLEALWLTAVDPEDPFAAPQTGTAYFNTDDVYDAQDGFQRLEFTSNNQDTTFVLSENEDSDDPQAESYGYAYKMVVTYSGNAAPADDIVITAKDAVEDWTIGVANVYVDEGA